MTRQKQRTVKTKHNLGCIHLSLAKEHTRQKWPLTVVP